MLYTDFISWTCPLCLTEQEGWDDICFCHECEEYFTAREVKEADERRGE